MARRLSRNTLAVLASLLALVLAAGQVLAGPDSVDTGAGVHHRLENESDPGIRERIADYTVINAPDEQQLDIIIGSDDRQQVTNTENFPNSAVAYLEAWDDDEDFVFLCSASFVAPNVLLTAAHCVWIPEFGGWPDGIVVAPGLNGSTEPFGFEIAEELWVPEGWIDAAGNINQGYPHDYALIKLDSDLGNETGQFTINVLETASLEAADFHPSTAGYPGDKPRGTQWYGADDAFTEVMPDLLVHEIDAFQGQSGSPVWRDSDQGVVGVVSFETSNDNYARRITTDVMSNLNAACDSMSCDLNYVIEGAEPEPTPTPTEEPSPTATSEPSPSPSPEPTVSPSPTPTSTATPAEGDLSAFERTWKRTDDPVLNGLVNRTWMWGPPFSAIMSEPYDDSPGGVRSVLYHEKSRMEITHPDGDPSSIWYVTNGLIAKELVTGQMQVGDNLFEERSPASINVAGDSNDPNGPTYATFLNLLDAPPAAEGSTITATINRSGTVASDPALAPHGVTAAHYAPETDHTVASVFWDFMNASGLVYDTGGYREALLFQSPYFATGLPITEAYWTTVKVGGTERVVLVQVFERRVLTYTPGNPPGWDVEAGNVGLHYYQWRYGALPTSVRGTFGLQPH